MPFNYDSFMSSPLTGVALGLLSSRGDDPIGAGITKGLLLSEQVRNSQAERANTEKLREYQQGVLAQQQQQYNLQMQKMQQELAQQAKQEQWAQSIASGDLKAAMGIDPVNTTKVIKDSRTKSTWADAGDRLVELDENGTPTGKEMPKGQMPSQAQPRQLSEMEMWMQNPSIVRKMWEDKASAQGINAEAKPPANYRWKPGESGVLEPIPGGPATVKPGGQKVLPATMIESLSDMDALRKTIQEAEQLATSKKVETGPVVGRKQSALSVAGMATDDFVDVSQKLQTAQNIMLKLRSGAAVSEAEYGRLLKEFPTVNDSPAVRTRKAKNATQYAQELLESKMQAFEDGGYKVPKFDTTKQNNATVKFLGFE